MVFFGLNTFGKEAEIFKLTSFFRQFVWVEQKLLLGRVVFQRLKLDLSFFR